MCIFADKNMLVMHMIFCKCISFVLMSFLVSSISVAQRLPDTPGGVLLAVDTLDQDSLFDSRLCYRDSLEILLLRTTQTYRQVERMLASFPANSTYLDLLPSVLPVDLPIQAFRISSPYGFRQHPIHQQTRFHGGVDVKASAGMIVKATAAGIVKRVGHDPALGVFVQVQHAFGFETTYGHLRGYCVTPGQSVTRNQEVGQVGQTGLATGPHLHYVIKKNGTTVDPFDFCFLLRRRLWFYAAKSKASGVPTPEAVNSLSSKE